MPRSTWLPLLLVASGLAAGCAKAADPKTPAERQAALDLRLFGQGYKNFHSNEDFPPQNLDDLKKMASSDQPLHFDRYHIIWGVDPAAATEGRAVLAYEKTVPEAGGMVLFLNGAVERVTAEEFQKLPKAPAAKPLAERTPDVTFTPAEYYAEFKAIGGDMARKYANKVVELKGVFKEFSPLSGGPELRVISPGNEQEDVRCMLPAGGEPWARISRGQPVTVKGFVRSPQGTPMLTRCEFTAAGPSLAAHATAEEFARDVAGDGWEKYRGKSVILTGEVAATEAWNSFLTVKLKGAAGKTADCQFRTGTDTKERDQKLVAGAKVKVYGEFDGNPNLVNCQLLSK